MPIIESDDEELSSSGFSNSPVFIQFVPCSFNLYNEIREHNKLIVVSSLKSLDKLEIIPDLKTRLSWGQSYNLYQVNDLDKIRLLQNITSDIGINLTISCINYLLTHYSRDVKKLISLIKSLDELAVSKKKKISIPLIKTFID